MIRQRVTLEYADELGRDHGLHGSYDYEEAIGRAAYAQEVHDLKLTVYVKLTITLPGDTGDLLPEVTTGENENEAE